MGTSEECIATGSHSTPYTLSSACFAAKGQGKIAERRVQAHRSLGDRGDKGGEALGEGDSRTCRTQTTKATEVKDAADGVTTHQ